MREKSKNIVLCRDLGLIRYAEAWDYQERLFDASMKIKLENRHNNTDKPVPHYFLFCEHPPVVTLGKNGKLHHLLLQPDQLKNLGIEFYPINRGGDITFHGPGQIVGYPILDLEQFYTDIHRYLRELEEVIILTLRDFGIEAERYAGYTGVWLDVDNPQKSRKICAMGVRCSRWLTMHGFALNVNTDLKYFNYIVPCGITNKQVTSMEKELGKKIPLEEVKASILKHFCEVFQCEVEIEESLIKKHL
ncbi:MAG: octanoyltransferase [Vicingaceae bacterium]|nr:MAG: octanoyltransferase [Vicingaceae bacterium]